MRHHKPKSERESTKALKQSTESLQEVISQHPEVRKVSRSLRILRENNHFADQLNFIIGGGS